MTRGRERVEESFPHFVLVWLYSLSRSFFFYSGCVILLAESSSILRVVLFATTTTTRIFIPRLTVGELFLRFLFAHVCLCTPLFASLFLPALAGSVIFLRNLSRWIFVKVFCSPREFGAFKLLWDYQVFFLGRGRLRYELRNSTFNTRHY